MFYSDVCVKKCCLNPNGFSSAFFYRVKKVVLLVPARGHALLMRAEGVSHRHKLDGSKPHTEQKELSLILKGTFAKDAYVLYAMRKSSHPVKVRPVHNAEVTASCGSTPANSLLQFVIFSIKSFSIETSLTWSCIVCCNVKLRLIIATIYIFRDIMPGN